MKTKGNFLSSVWSEMKKISWPTRKQAIEYTLTVVVVSVAVALFLGGLDYVFFDLLERFILF